VIGWRLWTLDPCAIVLPVGPTRGAGRQWPRFLLVGTSEERESLGSRWGRDGPRGEQRPRIRRPHRILHFSGSLWLRAPFPGSSLLLFPVKRSL
jgi:hypothetical protein